MSWDSNCLVTTVWNVAQVPKGVVEKKSVYSVSDQIVAHGLAVPPSHLDRRKRTSFLPVSKILSLNSSCVSHCRRKVLRCSCAPSKGEMEILNEEVVATVVMVMGW